jgi:negative regulator of sigma-B (phosphoserine phosphatase)
MKYGAVTRSKPGNELSGDTYFFHEDSTSTLVAMIDGLGSGHAAHEAAQRARQAVSEHTDIALTDILQQCHKALRGTRGAVMMLMRVDHEQQGVGFAGVGNIGVRVFGDTSIKPLSRNGIVGYRMNNTREFKYAYTKGDVFVLHSDGISTRFTVEPDWVRDPATDLQEVATEIADNFGKDDDMTVIVVR